MLPDVKMNSLKELLYREFAALLHLIYRAYNYGSCVWLPTSCRFLLFKSWIKLYYKYKIFLANYCGHD